MHEILIELAKGAANEVGKAAIKHLFSSRESGSGNETATVAARSAAVAPGDEQDWAAEPDQRDENSWDEPQWIADAFFQALKEGDHSRALTYCDPEWLIDPERRHTLDETLRAAAPESWAFREVYGPGDWDGVSPLPWIQVEFAGLYPVEGGRLEAVPARFWVAGTECGWRMWNIVWWPDRVPEPTPIPEQFDHAAFIVDSMEEQEHQASQVVPCTRCPQTLSIPVAIGRLRVKCPKCWTVQFIDS